METALMALWLKVESTWTQHKLCTTCPQRIAVLASPMDVPSPPSETDSFCSVLVQQENPQRCLGAHVSLSIATHRYTPETVRSRRISATLQAILWAAVWIACASLVLAFRALSS